MKANSGGVTRVDPERKLISLDLERLISQDSLNLKKEAANKIPSALL